MPASDGLVRARQGDTCRGGRLFSSLARSEMLPPGRSVPGLHAGAGGQLYIAFLRSPQLGWLGEPLL